MATNKRLMGLGAAASAAATFTPSEHFNTVLYTGTGASQRIGGYINRGAVFNGSSSKIDFSNYTVPTTNVTFSFWFRSQNTPSASAASEVLYTHFKGAQSYGVQIGSTTIGSYALASGGAADYLTYSWTHDTDWHHVAVTMGSTNGHVLYLDGSAVATDSALTSFHTGGTGSNLIGSSGSSKYFDGVIDQFRIFDKELSSSEVTTLYGETHASTTKSTTDIFDDGSGVALYQLDGNANDTGLVAAETIVSSNKIIDLNVDSYTSGTTIDDSTSNNNDATIVGDVSYDNWLGRGRFDLQGSSDYLKIDASTTFNGATDLTLEGWFRPDNLTATDHFFAIYNTSGSSNKLYLRLNDTDGDIDMHAYGSGSASIASLVTSNSSARVQANKWNHIVGVWESGTAMSVYINGVLAGTTASMGNLNTAGTEDLYIGVLKGYIGSYDFDGEVGEIRGYSSALTASEVLQNFNATRYYYAAYDGTASNITYQEATKFQPDLVWIQNRSSSGGYFNAVMDSIRGATNILSTNSTGAETTSYTQELTSFDSNGFTLGTGGGNYVNRSGDDYVAWCWKAGGAKVSNTNGSISGVNVSVNTDAGFSMVEFTSESGSGNTAGHGLGVTPKLVIFKVRNLSGRSWWTYTTVIDGSNDYLVLNGNAAKVDASEAAPTDSVITQPTTASGRNYIAYCFHDVDNYQKIGKYDGTGAADNRVETGFEPAFILVKNISNSTDTHWGMFDNKRDNTNPNTARILANLTNSESTTDANWSFDFTSNGFVVNSTSNQTNASGSTYLYLAIAADPDTTTPTVADSFDVVTYSGTGAEQDIEVDFKPDLVWIKGRTLSSNHTLSDTIRGAYNVISSNRTDSENYGGSVTRGVKSFNDNGFTLQASPADGGDSNNSGDDYVAWCWKAGDHDDNLPEINTEGSSGGSTLESIVSVNDAAGFSIVKYRGTGANATVGHGLSNPPELIIFKNLDDNDDWMVVAKVGNSYQRGKLNTDDLFSSSMGGVTNSTDPSSTVISLGNSGTTNGSGDDIIAYCWYSVEGYSEIGSYTGSGSAGKTINFAGSGFRPRWVMIKRTDVDNYWVIIDSVRDATDPYAEILWANVADDEENGGSTTALSFSDTGFSMSTSATGSSINASGGTYLYMAFK